MMDRPVALVTGASRGIGRGIAERLGRDGLAVAVNYARSAEAAEQVVAAIGSSGSEAVAVQGDVALADDRHRMLAVTLERFGRIDVLVNNAGITSPGRPDLLELKEEGWDQVFATNLKGPFFLAQQAALQMIDQIGRGVATLGKIINISSISSYTVSRNRVDYCMTKAAMGMMTLALAERLADEGITVFEISPGIVESDMTAPVKAKYDRLIDEGLTPIRRWGRPDDVARAISAIVADYFPFSTGQRIDVDGGFHIRRL